MKQIRNFERRMHVPALCLAFLCLASCGGGGGGATAVPPPPSLSSSAPSPGMIGDGRLELLLEWAQSTQPLPVPALAAVVVQHGQIAETAAIGMRSIDDNVPVTIDDQWHIGSLTKAITSTLAGVLVEQSVVRWDTTPQDVWPEMTQAIHPGFRDVTLEELLSHTSGMHNSEIVPNAARDSAPGTIVERRRIWVNELLSEAPAHQRGTFSYSNGGYVVAGAMLETLTGTPFETLLQEQLLAPLSMTGTGYGAPGNEFDLDQPWGHWEHNTSYEAVPPGPGSDNVEAITPAGRVHSTLFDYGHFMLAHISGARGIPGIVTDNTFTKLQTPVDAGYSLGWVVIDEPDEIPGEILMHTGSQGRWLTTVWLAPELDTGAYIAINSGGDRAAFTRDAFRQIIVERALSSQ